MLSIIHRIPYIRSNLCVAVLFFSLIRFYNSLDIPIGSFSRIDLPNGLSQINFYGAPPHSAFAVIQLHTPFNRVLVSTVASFDYDASQSCSHCGLSLLLSNTTENVTLHVYSMYDAPLMAWARADSYPSGYPWPGGCNPSVNNVANAAITFAIAELPDQSDHSKDTFSNLKYWTSTLSFTAAITPENNLRLCDCKEDLASQLDVVYYIYVRPLVSAGVLRNTYANPSPSQAANVLESLSSVYGPLGNAYYKIKIVPSKLGPSFINNLPVARVPGTAVVILIVAEYQNAGSTLRVAYSPSILYGCPFEQVTSYNYLRAVLPVYNVSQQLGCSILPKDSPIFYFLVAVFLISGLIYACACHWFVWPRCAVGLMIISSLVGSLLCFRYYSLYHDAVLILVVGVIFPGAVAMLVFIGIWCSCIRPTLYYHRVYGRGPLIRLHGHEHLPEQLVTPTGNQQPWDSHPDDLTNRDLPDSMLPDSLLPLLDEDLVHFNMGFSETADIDTAGVDHSELVYEAQSGFTATTLNHGSTTAEDGSPMCPQATNCCTPRDKRSNQFFSLRPRRIARLPPILPAAFLIVAYLCFLFGDLFSLTSSIGSYLAFVICIGVLVLAVFCIFKNFAFGLATALVGFYFTFSCTCLFLIPNALLPHILIEQFLRLAWIERRLAALQLHAYGLYDIILQVIWLLVSVILGLITLCLIRLKDAQELSVTTRRQVTYNQPAVSQQTLVPSLSAGDQPVAPGISTAISTTHYWWERGTPVTTRPSNQALAFLTRLISSDRAEVPASTVSLSMADSTGAAANTGTAAAASGRLVSSELQHLLHNAYRRTNYGGLSTGPPLAGGGGCIGNQLVPSNPAPLVPLSRVQLRTSGVPAVSGTGLRRTTDSFPRLTVSPPSCRTTTQSPGVTNHCVEHND